MQSEKDRISISESEGKILHELVYSLKPYSLVEVGTGYGVSAQWIALGMPYGASFVTLEVSPRPECEKHPDVKYFRGTLSEQLDEIRKPIDFAFLDGDHQIEKIVRDIEILVPHLKSGSVIAVHDIEYCPEMGICLQHYFEGIESDHTRAIPIKPSDQRWSYRTIHTDSGLGVATYA